MDKMSNLEAIAKTFIDNMPKHQADELKQLPEAHQKELLGKCYDLMKDYIKAKFIDFVMEELKKG